MNRLKEYIKINGANTIVANIEKMSADVDGALTNTHVIQEHRKEKYHEIAHANALSLSLLHDIQTLNGFFTKKEIAEEETIRKRGRPRKIKVQEPKRKRGRPRKNLKIKRNLKLLKRSLRK